MKCHVDKLHSLRINRIILAIYEIKYSYNLIIQQSFPLLKIRQTDSEQT